MGQKQLKTGHWHFIACFLGHGVAAQAALEAGYSRKSPRTIGCGLLHKPEILAGCLMQAIALHAEGQGPDGRAVRQLCEIVPDRLGKGLNEHDFDGLPSVEEAFRQFCLALGLDERRLMPRPMPVLAGPAPDGTERAASAPPVRPVLPRWKLPRAFLQLKKPSRYKALHGGR
uniref:hypothetical protein n=1 Tax=Inquilinus sp. OTU3971 TaxID=3043855 RepID=UPI00313D1E7A